MTDRMGASPWMRAKALPDPVSGVDRGFEGWRRAEAAIRSTVSILLLSQSSQTRFIAAGAFLWLETKLAGHCDDVGEEALILRAWVGPRCLSRRTVSSCAYQFSFAAIWCQKCGSRRLRYVMSTALEIEVSCGIWRRQNAHAVNNLVSHLRVLRSVARERVGRIYAFDGFAAMDVCRRHSVASIKRACTSRRSGPRHRTTPSVRLVGAHGLTVRASSRRWYAPRDAVLMSG